MLNLLMLLGIFFYNFNISLLFSVTDSDPLRVLQTQNEDEFLSILDQKLPLMKTAFQEELLPVRENLFSLLQKRQSLFYQLKSIDWVALMRDVALNRQVRCLLCQIEAETNQFFQMDELFSKKESAFREQWIAPIAAEYAWGLLDDSAMQVIAQYSPLVELGAGTGYWAMRLQKDFQVDLIAYDDRSWEVKREWGSVLLGDASKLLEPQCQQRNLFLSWPPKTHRDGDLAYEALSNFQGEYFLYLGELPEDVAPLYPSMGGLRFFKLLDQNYECIQVIRVPQWPGYSDKLRIYKKAVRQNALFEQDFIRLMDGGHCCLN